MKCQENQKKSREALQYFSFPQMFLMCSSDVHIPSQTALSYFPLYIAHKAQHYFNVQPSYTDSNANDTLTRSHYRSQKSVFLLIAGAIGRSNALTSDCCFPCWLIKAQEMGTARAGRPCCHGEFRDTGHYQQTFLCATFQRSLDKRIL